MTDQPDENNNGNYVDEHGVFHEDAHLEDLEGWLDNHDDPDLSASTRLVRR